MGHKAVALVDIKVDCPTKVAFYVLGIGNAAHAILPEGILRSMGEVRKAV